MTDENEQRQDNDPVEIPSAIPGAEFLGFAEVPGDYSTYLEEGDEMVLIDNSDLPEEAFTINLSVAEFAEKFSTNLRELADSGDALNFFNVLTSGIDALSAVAGNLNQALTAVAMAKMLEQRINQTSEEGIDEPSRN